MPFNEPSQQQIFDRIRADFEAELEGADARLRFTFERIASKVLGKASFYAHRHIAFLTRQPFPDTSDVENLDRHILIWGLDDGLGGIGRKPARAAAGKTQVTGASPGAISIGDVLTRADGARYTADANTSFTSPANEVKDVAVTAEEVGDEGNTDPGSTLTFEADHTGIESDSSVDGDGLTLGADRESDADAIVRLLAKIREPGSGGGPGDYITFALAADVNVTRVFELPRELGPSTVLVLIANDNQADPVPSQELIDTVQDFIQKVETAAGGFQKITGKAPVTADVTVNGILTNVVDYSATITLVEGAVQATVKAAIEAEVAAFLTRIAEPGLTITTNQLLVTIGNAAGVLDVDLTAPVSDITHTATQIPIAGTFTGTFI